MKDLLILAIISQLFIYANTLYPPHRDGFGVCDVVGTHTDLTYTFVQRRTKQCICNPGFYGHRCEKIYKCRSGRSMNISCASPEEYYASEAALRCIRGQVDLEVCECFVGYTGHLCQNAETIINPEYANLQPIGYGVSHDFDEKDEADVDKRVQFLSNTHIDEDYESYQRLHAFYGRLHGSSLLILLLISFLLLCIFAISIIRLFRSRQYKTEYVPVSTIQVPSSEGAPPPYTKADQEVRISHNTERDVSRTSTESSDEALPMPPTLRPYLHV